MAGSILSSTPAQAEWSTVSSKDIYSGVAKFVTAKNLFKVFLFSAIVFFF